MSIEDPFKNEKRPELISEKLSDLISLLQKPNKHASKEYNSTIEKMFLQSELIDFGIGVEKIKDNSGWYNYYLTIADEKDLLKTFNEIYRENEKYGKKSDSHEVMTDMMDSFHETLLEEKIDEESRFDVYYFLSRYLDSYVDKYDKLYYERNADPEEYLSDSYAYKEINLLLSAIKNNFFAEYKTLYERGFISELEIKAEILDGYLSLKESKQYNNINDIYNFLTQIHKKVRPLVEIPKKEDNEEYKKFIQKIKNGVISYLEEIINLTKNPKKFSYYGVLEYVENKKHDKTIREIISSIIKEIKG